MLSRKSSVLADSSSPGAFPTLLSLLLLALVFSAGCAQVEEVAQQREDTFVCGSETDNFDEDWPRIVADQRERASHKALAYAKSTESSCFIWGYSVDYDSRQDAAERAMSECRKFKSKAEERGHPVSECTLYSVDGEQQ